MESINSDVAAISYPKLKSLMAIHQVMGGYEYGISDTMDSIINGNLTYIQKETKSKWFFFSETVLSVTATGQSFYDLNKGKVEDVTSIISEVYKTEKDPAVRKEMINNAVTANFTSFSEFIMVRDVLAGMISWDDMEHVLYSTATNRYLSKRMSARSDVLNRRSSRRYDFDCYYDDDCGLDIWDIYFMMELMGNGEIPYTYIEDVEYLEAAVIEEPAMETSVDTSEVYMESTVEEAPSEIVESSYSEPEPSYTPEPEPERSYESLSDFGGSSSCDSDDSSWSRSSSGNSGWGGSSYDSSSYDSGSSDCGGGCDCGGDD